MLFQIPKITDIITITENSQFELITFINEQTLQARSSFRAAGIEHISINFNEI